MKPITFALFPSTGFFILQILSWVIVFFFVYFVVYPITISAQTAVLDFLKDYWWDNSQPLYNFAMITNLTVIAYCICNNTLTPNSSFGKQVAYDYDKVGENDDSELKLMYMKSTVCLKSDIGQGMWKYIQDYIYSIFSEFGISFW